MVTGEVTPAGEVLIHIPVAGRIWPAAIDTGFNGDLELPEALFRPLQPLFSTPAVFELGGGQEIVEDVFIVDFPFDGEVIAADATFVDTDTILIGTGLMRHHRLEIDFVARTVRLEHVAGP